MWKRIVRESTFNMSVKVAVSVSVRNLSTLDYNHQSTGQSTDEDTTTPCYTAGTTHKWDGGRRATTNVKGKSNKQRGQGNEVYP